MRISSVTCTELIKICFKDHPYQDIKHQPKVPDHSNPSALFHWSWQCLSGKAEETQNKETREGWQGGPSGDRCREGQKNSQRGWSWEEKTGEGRRSRCEEEGKGSWSWEEKGRKSEDWCPEEGTKKRNSGLVVGDTSWYICFFHQEITVTQQSISIKPFIVFMSDCTSRLVSHDVHGITNHY